MSERGKPGCPAGLVVDARVRVGSLELDVQLEAAPGEIVAVVGPNGAGKSTLLRCIAGLTPLDGGRIEVDGEPLDAPDDDVFVPPERRSIGVVFQDHLLFESMSALDNVAFGLRAQGKGKQAARDVALAWLQRVGLDDHAGHLPQALSGGQAQRVALGRALVTDPRVLLLDEPLAALDAGARSSMRVELKRHLDTFPGMRLLVTHDPVDAHALADRVVVVERGRVAQQGSLADVTAHPRSRYVADLVGMSVVTGRLRDRVLTTADGTAVVVGSAEGDGPAAVVIRPQVVALHRHRPDGSARNVWQLRVVDIHRRQDLSHVSLDGALRIVAEVTAAALDDLALHVGDDVWAAVKATELAAVTA